MKFVKRFVIIDIPNAKISEAHTCTSVRTYAQVMQGRTFGEQKKEIGWYGGFMWLQTFHAEETTQSN